MHGLLVEMALQHLILVQETRCADLAKWMQCWFSEAKVKNALDQVRVCNFIWNLGLCLPLACRSRATGFRFGQAVRRTVKASKVYIPTICFAGSHPFLLLCRLEHPAGHVDEGGLAARGLHGQTDRRFALEDTAGEGSFTDLYLYFMASVRREARRECDSYRDILHFKGMVVDSFALPCSLNQAWLRGLYFWLALNDKEVDVGNWEYDNRPFF